MQALYEELLKDVKGVHIHKQPADPRYDANFWLCAATLDPEVRIVGQENAYKEVIKTAVGGAAGVIHQVESGHYGLSAQRQCGGSACVYAGQED